MSIVDKHAADNEIGRGPLSRGAAVVYRYLVLEVLLLVTALPTALVLVLLDRDVSNAPLFVMAFLPIGPALVAGLGALRAWEVDADLAPARAFWRVYRAEFLATLAWWGPMLALLAILGVNLANMSRVEGGEAFGPLSAGVGLVVGVWAGHMLVLQARFTFRLRDAARIALAEIVPQWRFSLGVISLMIVAAAIAVLASEAVVALFAWALLALLSLMARPLVLRVTERFTRHD